MSTSQQEAAVNHDDATELTFEAYPALLTTQTSELSISDEAELPSLPKSDTHSTQRASNMEDEQFFESLESRHCQNQNDRQVFDMQNFHSSREALTYEVIGNQSSNALPFPKTF